MHMRKWLEGNFSKIILFSFVVGLHIYILFELALKFFNGYNTDPSVTVAYITVVGGAVVAYYVTNAMTKCNVNKNGLTIIPPKDYDGRD